MNVIELGNYMKVQYPPLNYFVVCHKMACVIKWLVSWFLSCFGMGCNYVKVPHCYLEVIKVDPNSQELVVSWIEFNHDLLNSIASITIRLKTS